MNAFFTFGVLTLIGRTLGESSLNWGDTEIALKKNDFAPSYSSNFNVCPQKMPHCPANAEARCTQDPRSRHIMGPSNENTRWRCVLCEDNAKGTACFLVTPIKTYYKLKMPSKKKRSKATELKRFQDDTWLFPRNKQKHDEQLSKPRELMRQQQHQVHPQMVIQRQGFYLPTDPPRNIPQVNPKIQYQQANNPYQQPNIPYQQPNIPYEQQHPPTYYGYQQEHYLTNRRNPSQGQPMLNPYNMYSPQTTPCMDYPCVVLRARNNYLQ